MAEFKFATNKIFELGDYISKFLNDNGVIKDNKLIVKVSDTDLRRIDEDLFYRNKTEGEFTPSDREVEVKFKNLCIIFSKENADGR